MVDVDVRSGMGHRVGATFNGLAISLIFGIFVSTLLTLVVIPVLFYAYQRRRLARAAQGGN